MLVSVLKTLIRSYLSSAMLKMVSGLRMFTLFIVAIIVSAMMCCVSGFAGIAYAIYQHKISGNVVLDGLLIFFSIIFIISLLIFLKLMCKRRWTNALLRY